MTHYDLEVQNMMAVALPRNVCIYYTTVLAQEMTAIHLAERPPLEQGQEFRSSNVRRILMRSTSTDVIVPTIIHTRLDGACKRETWNLYSTSIHFFSTFYHTMSQSIVR
jgi:hypothetical protein